MRELLKRPAKHALLRAHSVMGASPTRFRRILYCMLGIDRRVLQTAWTLFLFLFTLAAIYEIRRTLVLFALALFLANLLSPVVERVHWLIPPSGSRGPAETTNSAACALSCSRKQKPPIPRAREQADTIFQFM